MMEKTTSKSCGGLILLRDEETVLVPFNDKILSGLICDLQNRMRTLEASGDYPEKAQDKLLFEDLCSAQFMVTQKPAKARG